MRYRRFETEVIVRPDDIDLNNHVHNSKYLDYVLFARFDQMGRCYGMPIDEFLSRGWTWFAKSCAIEFKRPLNMGERPIVQTWLESWDGADVTVGFQILKGDTRKLAAQGHFVNTMVSIATGRPEQIPEWVIRQYAQFTEEEVLPRDPALR